MIIIVIHYTILNKKYKERIYYMGMQVKDIRVGYEEKTILHDLSLEIPYGKITTIIGSNGCGKSTLLKAMTRIIAHQRGQIIIDGKDIRKVNTKDLAKKLAILPQNPESANGLLVKELVSYGRFPYQKGFGGLTKQDNEIIDWALEVTRTNEMSDKPVDALSGGQRQRVWIALALAQDTDTIFLDEPTTYLDMAHQLEVLELLWRLNKQENKTIVMVLHDLNQAARFSDYIIALSNGKLVRAGNAEEVVTREVLMNVFNIDAVITTDPRTNKPICITYDLVKGEYNDEKNNTTNSNLTYASASIL
jgi:iron complex transport system ATP-binding protein